MKNGIRFSQCGKAAFIGIVSKRHGEVFTIVDTDALPRIEAAMATDGASLIGVNLDRGHLRPYWSKREGDRRKTEYLYWAVLGHRPNGTGQLHVDHVSGDTLDNRTANLRVVDCRTNRLNDRRHRLGCVPGVGRDGQRGKWCSRVRAPLGLSSGPGTQKRFDLAMDCHNFCQLLRRQYGVPELELSDVQKRWLVDQDGPQLAGM